MRDREIAKTLFISDRTIKFHINNAVAKLKARTRIQAVYQAYSQGLLISIFWTSNVKVKSLNKHQESPKVW